MKGAWLWVYRAYWLLMLAFHIFATKSSSGAGIGVLFAMLALLGHKPWHVRVADISVGLGVMLVPIFVGIALLAGRVQFGEMSWTPWIIVIVLAYAASGVGWYATHRMYLAMNPDHL